MIRSATTTFDLTPAELHVAATLVGIDELPVVLGPTATDDSDGRVRESLSARGLLPGESQHADLADLLTVLTRPDSELALRWYHGDTVSRMCLSRNAVGSVLALRGQESVVISAVDPDPDLVLQAIGNGRAAEVTTVSAPTVELSEALSRIAHPPAVLRDLAHIGVHGAESVVHALARCHAHAEIVTIVHEDGNRVTSPPVAVFDTAAGRLVGTSTTATDGTAWSTLGPGDDARVRQAVRTLMDWTPTTR